VALGEAVTLTLQSRAADLDKLDTAPLDAAFDVASRTGSQDAAGDTLVLTLYPRRSGTLRVPALSVEGRRSPALLLTVTDGSATVPRVTANWTLAPAAPRVNEPARLTLSLCDDGSLQWQRPDLPTHAGRIVRALGEDEGEAVQDGERCTLHRYYWALLPTRSAAHGGRFHARRQPLRRTPAFSRGGIALPRAGLAGLVAGPRAAGCAAGDCRSSAYALAVAAPAGLAR